MTLPSDLPSLPEPESDALALSHALEAHIRERIHQSGGWISFGQFMQYALYEPGMGYYSAGSRKFGEFGDFVTAPESSVLFGICLARQIGMLFDEAGLDVVFELGAGTGKLAAQVLQELNNNDQLPSRYYILEVSADLRSRQQATLTKIVPQLMDRVVWLDELPLEKLKAVVIANEVLDALPVERFCIDEYGVVQNRGVTWKTGFQDTMRPASGSLLRYVRRIQDAMGESWPVDYQSEVCLQLQPWLASVLACVSQGMVFLIDYGLPEREYYLPERNGGTLMCYYRHRVHEDPYHRVGLQDISAWVNFTQAAHAAQLNGYKLAGFTTQAHFLIGLGSDVFNAALSQDDERSRIAAIQEIKTLTMPGQMGERFKVMALSRDLDVSMDAFSLRDFRGSL